MLKPSILIRKWITPLVWDYNVATVRIIGLRLYIELCYDTTTETWVPRVYHRRSLMTNLVLEELESKDYDEVKKKVDKWYVEQIASLMTINE